MRLPVELALDLLLRLEKERAAAFTDREKALLELSKRIASSLDRFQDEVAREPLYATS